MKRNLKMSMLVLVLLLAVGFAAVSTTLVINNKMMRCGFDITSRHF